MKPIAPQRTTSRLAAWSILAIWAVLTAGPAPTHAQGFCDNRAYISVGNGPGATVYRLDFDGTTLDFVPVLNLADVGLNSWDINPADGLIYGSDFPGGPLVRVDAGGGVTNITPPGWDTSISSFGAGISEDGSTWSLIKVDQANGNDRDFCNVDLTVGPPFAFSCADAQPNAIMTDLVYTQGSAFTVGGATGRLRRVDPASGAGSDLRDDFPESSPGGYGTLFGETTSGDLFSYGNATGQLLHLDAATDYDWSVIAESGLPGGHTDGGACNFEGFCGPDVDGDGTGDFCESDLGDLVWYDTNQNGVQSPGEPGLANVVVELYASPDCSGSSEWSEISGAAGDWRVETIPPSPNSKTESYCLEFTLPSGVPWIWSPRQAGGDPDLDSNVDADGRQTHLRVFSFDDMTRDAGAYANGQISGLVYCDANDTGAPDPGEGIAGASLELHADVGCDGTATGDAVIRSVVTEVDGTYRYAPQLPAGPPSGPPLCYLSVVDAASLPDDCNVGLEQPPLCGLTADERLCDEEVRVEPTPVPVDLQAFSVE